MTDIQKFNLLWLCHVMTVPNYCLERYFYDGKTQKFFYTVQPLNPSKAIEVFDSIDMNILDSEREQLLERIKEIDSFASEVVEIPRLHVTDKVNIQLLFLSKTIGVYHHDDLIHAVEQQTDDYKFVLDVVLIENDLAAPMAPYWDDFKLKTIQYYLEKFTGVVGIALRLTQ